MKINNATFIKLIILIFLGISCGSSWILLVSTLGIRLAQAGIDKSTIGIFASITFPYSTKFLWAPLIDAYKVPIITNMLGHRKSWLILSQILLAFSIIKLGLLDPLKDIHQMMLWCFITAFLGATQEISIHAYRMAIFKRSEFALSVSFQILGYRIGNIICGGFLLLFVDYLCKANGLCQNSNWFFGFSLIALVIIISCLLITLIEKENDLEQIEVKPEDTNIKSKFLNPLQDLLKTKNIALIFIFIFTYRWCDYLIYSMVSPFLIEIGFSLTEIGLIVKSFGLCANIFGSFIAGFINHNINLYKALFIASSLQMFSNLAFIFQASVGHSADALYFTVMIEYSCSGIASSVLAAYISSLCSSHKYSATQYSLLDSLSAFGFIIISFFSGFIAQKLGWIAFFSVSFAFGVPSFIMLFFIKYRSKR